MKTKTSSKILAMLLSMVMLVSCMTFTAFAEITDNGIIDTEEEFIAAIAAGDTVELGGNITLTNVITITKDVIINGNGYIIDSNFTDRGTYDIFTLVSGIEVTVSNVTFQDFADVGNVVMFQLDSDATNARLTLGEVDFDNSNATASNNYNYYYAVFAEDGVVDALDCDFDLASDNDAGNNILVGIFLYNSGYASRVENCTFTACNQTWTTYNSYGIYYWADTASDGGFYAIDCTFTDCTYGIGVKGNTLSYKQVVNNATFVNSGFIVDALNGDTGTGTAYASIYGGMTLDSTSSITLEDAELTVGYGNYNFDPSKYTIEDGFVVSAQSDGTYDVLTAFAYAMIEAANPLYAALYDYETKQPDYSIANYKAIVTILEDAIDEVYALTTIADLEAYDAQIALDAAAAIPTIAETAAADTSYEKLMMDEIVELLDSTSITIDEATANTSDDVYALLEDAVAALILANTDFDGTLAFQSSQYASVTNFVAAADGKDGGFGYNLAVILNDTYADTVYGSGVVIAAQTEVVAEGTADMNVALADDTLESVFSAEELALGVDLKVVLTADAVEIEDLHEDEQTLITETVAALAEKAVFGFVLDLSLTKWIGDEETNVTDLDGKVITVTIDVPEDYLADGRTFSIIRIHDGVVTVLDDLDDDPTTITFETGLFSTYAVSYVDEVADEEEAEESDGVATGDSTTALPIAMAIGALVCMTVVFKKRSLVK